jgi:murein tripeptide amidase MpaA
MSLLGFRIALPRATNWRVDLWLDPRLESSATTASRSHQAARRHLIDILGRRFAAEKWDMRDDVSGFRIALPRATNWRVDLRLDPRLKSSATTASRSHQAARRHLIDILGRRFAAEK